MKTQNWLLGAATCAILIGSLVGVGCKSSSNKNANATKTAQSMVTPARTTPKGTSTPTAGTTPGSGAQSEIAVNLVEYQIQARPASVPAGTVTFNAKNLGTAEHEMVVLKTDLAPTALTRKADGSAKEDGPGITPIDEIESLEAGGARSLTVNLEAGHYLLICNVVQETNGQTVSHYQQGMTTEFTVTP